MAVLKKPAKKNGTKQVESASAETLAWVELSALTFDEAYQMRDTIPSSDEYAELIKSAEDGVWPFAEPMLVAKIGSKLYVVGGFTRGRAALEAGSDKVYCKIVETTKEKAFKLALAENASHGYRRTNADKQKAVRCAIGRFPNLSALKIAELCKVSHTYVYNTIEKLKSQTGVSEQELSEAAPEVKPEALAKPAGSTDDSATVDTATGSSDFPEYEDAGAEVETSGLKETFTPTSIGAPVDLDADRRKRARAELGKLVRTLEEMGLIESAHSHVAQLQAMIG